MIEGAPISLGSPADATPVMSRGIPVVVSMTSGADQEISRMVQGVSTPTPPRETNRRPKVKASTDLAEKSPAPKKRGRKPKAASSNQDPSPIETTPEASLFPEPESLLPAMTNSLASNGESSAAQADISPVKRRGRLPKKNTSTDVAPVAPGAVASDTEATVAARPPESVEAATPKRRGRPPKNKAIESSSPAEPSSLVDASALTGAPVAENLTPPKSADETPPKRRGRPPKAKEPAMDLGVEAQPVVPAAAPPSAEAEEPSAASLSTATTQVEEATPRKKRMRKGQSEATVAPAQPDLPLVTLISSDDLPRPIYVDQWVALYVGDNTKITQDVVRAEAKRRGLPLDKPFIDHIITDPPYSPRVQSNSISVYHGKEENVVQRVYDFEPMTIETMEKCARIWGPIVQGWVLIFTDDQINIDWRKTMTSVGGLEEIDQMLWWKPNGPPRLSGDRPAHWHELIEVFHAMGEKGKPKRKRWNRGGGPGRYVFRSENDKQHNGVKPIRLMRALVADFTQPKQTIFDPYGGRCTTLMAARDLHRFAFAIELNEDHAWKGAKRLAQQILPLDFGDMVLDESSLEDNADVEEMSPQAVFSFFFDNENESAAFVVPELLPS